jgi:hypothetical protein
MYDKDISPIIQAGALELLVPSAAVVPVLNYISTTP